MNLTEFIILVLIIFWFSGWAIYRSNSKLNKLFKRLSSPPQDQVHPTEQPLSDAVQQVR